MEFSTEFRKMIYNYYLWLDDGNSAPVFKQQRQHIDGMIHCSNLMDCPLKAAKEFAKAQPVFPQLSKRNNPTLLQRMNQGNMCAQPFQEALLWAKDQNILKETQIESFVKSEELKLQGQMDGFVTELDGTTHIIEFKHRLPTWKDKFPQPRMGDVFQLLAYLTMTNSEQGHLVIINTPQYAEFFNPLKGFEIWTLYQDQENKEGFILQNEQLDAWYHPFNHGAYINRDTLMKEVERQLEYINGKEIPPIDLNSEDRWQCLKINKYQKGNNIGEFHVQCPYFCHTENPSENMSYILDDDGNFVILE